MEEAEDAARSLLLCNSGMVFTTRMSEPREGDGEVRMPDETFGIDSVFAVGALGAGPTSGVEMVVAGVDAEVGRTRDLIFSCRERRRARRCRSEQGTYLELLEW